MHSFLKVCEKRDSGETHDITAGLGEPTTQKFSNE